MAFPSSPVNGQQATVNGILYTYDSGTKSWTRVQGVAGNITSTGNITALYFIGNGSALTGVSTGFNNVTTPNGSVVSTSNSKISFSSADSTIFITANSSTNTINFSQLPGVQGNIDWGSVADSSISTSYDFGTVP